jgi:hypothetical protein
MFVRNKTPFDVRLAKGHITDERAAGAIVVQLVLRAAEGRLESLAEPPAKAETDPPDTSVYTLWKGASVTAAGSALGPSKPPYVRGVALRVGAEERRLVVFGNRRWKARLMGGLEPSTPEPFDRIELSWKRAFGGGYDVPPGLMPGSGLPHPGYRVGYPLNDGGVGYYPDEAHARGGPLPNIELPTELLRAWNDTPEPAGFTPCRELVALRMKDEYEEIGRRFTATQDEAALHRDVFPSLRLQHHAAGRLIFDDLAPGAAIELQGLGTAPVRFTVPPSPVRVFGRLRRGEAEAAPRLRAVHIDADRSLVRVIFDHSFTYDPRRAPSWIRVAPAQRGAP